MFNNEDTKLVQKIKDVVRKIKPFELPPANAYLVITLDGWIGGWGVVLKFRSSEENPIKEQKNSRYDSVTFNINVSSTDAEILVTIKTLEKFKLFVISSNKFTL